MTVAVAIFILFSGITLIKDTLSTLLGKPPEKEQVEKIKNKLLSYENVIGIHDLIVHDYGVGRQFASVHIEMPAEADVIQSHELIDKIEKDFLVDDGLELVIHFDPVSTTHPLTLEIREFIAVGVKTINENLSVHDIRIVEGKVRNIVIFDCVLPYNLKMSEAEVKDKLTALIKSKYESFDAVITIDKCYV
jgi:divalent metal cation (Fe/Co/Zn/Cd) transporter